MYLRKTITVLLSLAALSQFGIAQATTLEEARSYQLDPANSFVRHHSLLDGSPSPTTTVAGQLEVIITDYYWEDPLILGTTVFLGTADRWLALRDGGLSGLPISPLFALPTFQAAVSGSSFEGDNGACSYPHDPRLTCSGPSIGLLSSFSGLLSPDTLFVQGIAYDADNNYYEYQFSAIRLAENTVGSPTSLVLCLAMIPLLTRRETARHRFVDESARTR